MPAYTPGSAPALRWAHKTEELVMTQPGIEPERININNLANCAQWAKKLNVTDEQPREALLAVGDRASDVEMPLKGSRSTTNDDRMRDLRDA